jgi:hypothetical protein
MKRAHILTQTTNFVHIQNGKFLRNIKTILTFHFNLKTSNKRCNCSLTLPSILNEVTAREKQTGTREDGLISPKQIVMF